MAQYHFVEDYERLVDSLIASHPIDQAMALAVGGNYEGTGQVEFELLLRAGLRQGSSLLDIGCGSGRLPHAISKSGLGISFTGTDVVQSLLDYAKTKCSPTYKFLLNRTFDLPVPSSSMDLVSSFSVFTHLLHHEIYLYMQDAYRALKSDGRLIFSFLEFAEPDHWQTFVVTATMTKTNSAPHLNTFIDRNSIYVWANKIGFLVEEFVGATSRVVPTGALGQSVAVLRKI